MQLKDWPIGMGWLPIEGYAIKVGEPGKVLVYNKTKLETIPIGAWFIPDRRPMFYIPRSLL